jgi:hypothetical protein
VNLILSRRGQADGEQQQQQEKKKMEIVKETGEYERDSRS